MKCALKILLIMWLSVSMLSLAGLMYLLPSYGIVGAFAEVLRTPQSDQLVRWLHFCELSFLLATLMSALLFRTYWKHFGKL